MFWGFYTRRSIARLAACLLVFASLQAALSQSGADRARLPVEGVAFPSETTGRHDHTTTVCHSCTGHVCLEQHGALGHTPAPLAVLASATVAIEPWPAAEVWAHPPTGPPRAAFVHFISLPRAPPELS